MTDAPEFSRILRLDMLGEAGQRQFLVADESERAALATRFGLLALDRLEAEVECTRAGEVVELTGRLRAAVTQSCVATAHPLPVVIDDGFAVRFVPQARFDSDTEEVELSADDCDIMPYAGSAIDLGEAVAETLVLALDPFPRADNADAVLRAAGVIPEEEAGPFAALKALKDKMGKA